MDIQGHRGARGLLPENTLAAFALSLDLGVSTLELDCGITRDAVVVVNHDRALNPDLTRNAQGRWIDSPRLIAHVTFDELQRYDVGRIKPGTAYAQRFPRQQPIDGARIPRLSDVFALVRERGDEAVRFNIETKISPLAPDETAPPDAFVGALLEAVYDAGVEARVVIQSFDWRTLAIVRNTVARIPTACLTAERASPRNIAPGSPWTAGHDITAYSGSVPRMVHGAGAAIWSPDVVDLSESRVREAHTLGLKVVAWTVNEEADMRRLIAWGVDGMISDYPDVLMRVAGCVD